MLNKLEREVITDSMLKIQSVQESLNEIDTARLINLDEVRGCLRSAAKTFRTALKSGLSIKKPIKG